MAGIYIHIPFCKQACHYCDFHFSTQLSYRAEMVEALAQELRLQQHYLAAAPVETIYFGGGTPSLLTAEEINLLLQTIADHYAVGQDPEITLEANPDDLHIDVLRQIKEAGINRLSIGIQSFREDDLQQMNRAHTAQEGVDCIQNARKLGIDNLSIDLIYGLPSCNMDGWMANIDTALELEPSHLSAYWLTVEPQTALAAMIKKGTVATPSEEDGANQFRVLMDRMEAAGYEHYEISNFCRNGNYSKHNTSYWMGTPYLGIGPSAHSFNGNSRQWNVRNNARYLQAMREGKVPFEIEELDAQIRLNEYIMTSLRTMWGISLQKVEMDFGQEAIQHLEKEIRPHLQEGWVEHRENHLILSAAGKLLADRIASDLFVTDDDHNH